MQWEKIGVPDGERPAQGRIARQDSLMAGQAQDFAQGQLVLRCDHVEESSQVRRDQGIDVSPSDIQIRFSQCHLHIGNEVAEEVPFVMHGC